MKICDVTTGTIKLQRARKTLQEQWADVQEHWHDRTRDEFDEKYLQTLAPQLSLAIAAVNRLAELLQRVERECE